MSKLQFQIRSPNELVIEMHGLKHPATGEAPRAATSLTLEEAVRCREIMTDITAKMLDLFVEPRKPADEEIEQV